MLPKFEDYPYPEKWPQIKEESKLLQELEEALFEIPKKVKRWRNDLEVLYTPEKNYTYRNHIWKTTFVAEKNLCDPPHKGVP